QRQETTGEELLLVLLALIFLPAAGKTPSLPPNGSSSSPSFLRSRLTPARRSLCSDFAPFRAADLRERRPRHGCSGGRPDRRQHAATGSRRRSRRLEVNPAELLRHQLRLIILFETPQESHGLVQRGGRSTTVFSKSNLATPSSFPVQSSTLPHPYVHGILSAAARSRRLRWFGHHWLGRIEEWNRKDLLYIFSFDLDPIRAAVCRRRA
uniref:Uncharacterized protein n=1 Tax=Oryza meridionalis TaxID=40149 RepID=A0A0E0DKP1_9ORYZ